MSRGRVAALSLCFLVALPLLASCKKSEDISSSLPPPSKAFCDAAAKYDAKVNGAKPLDQINMVQKIAATAPKDTKKDAELFLSALERVNEGDKSVVDNPKIKKAVDHVNRRASQDCGWFKNQGM
jgi:hypothetical protein